jgi:hypothetical protein
VKKPKVPAARVIELSLRDVSSARASAFLDIVMGVRMYQDNISKLNLFEYVAICEIEESTHDCDSGAVCQTYCMIDAIIMRAILRPWEFGSYKAADDRDFEIMKKSVIATRNFRRVFSLYNFGAIE